MATRLETTLSAKVETVRGNKLRFVTNVTVYMSDIEVAKATLGGRWSGPAALKEFARTPGRFARCFPGYDMAQAFGLMR